MAGSFEVFEYNRGRNNEAALNKIKNKYKSHDYDCTIYQDKWQQLKTTLDTNLIIIHIYHACMFG